jgi:hypothetical protein
MSQSVQRKKQDIITLFANHQKPFRDVGLQILNIFQAKKDVITTNAKSLLYNFTQKIAEIDSPQKREIFVTQLLAPVQRVVPFDIYTLKLISFVILISVGFVIMNKTQVKNMLKSIKHKSATPTSESATPTSESATPKSESATPKSESFFHKFLVSKLSEETKSTNSEPYIESIFRDFIDSDKDGKVDRTDWEHFVGHFIFEEKEENSQSIDYIDSFNKWNEIEKFISTNFYETKNNETKNNEIQPWFPVQLSRHIQTPSIDNYLKNNQYLIRYSHDKRNSFVFAIKSDENIVHFVFTINIAKGIHLKTGYFNLKFNSISEFLVFIERTYRGMQSSQVSTILNVDDNFPQEIAIQTKPCFFEIKEMSKADMVDIIMKNLKDKTIERNKVTMFVENEINYEKNSIINQEDIEKFCTKYKNQFQQFDLQEIILQFIEENICFIKLSKDITYPILCSDMATKICKSIQLTNEIVLDIVTNVMKTTNTDNYIREQDVQNFCKRFCFRQDNGDINKGFQRVKQNFYDDKSKLYAWFNTQPQCENKLKIDEFIIDIYMKSNTPYLYMYVQKGEDKFLEFILKIEHDGVVWVNHDKNLIMYHTQTIPYFIEYVKQLNKIGKFK